MKQSMYYSKGMSLVELMVALLIGTFLILGVTTIFINSKALSKFQDERLNNQSGVRLSELVFGDLLGQAGYQRAPDQLTDYAFPEVAAQGDCAAFKQGEIITPLIERGIGTGVCIRYQPVSRNERDCQGNLVKVASVSNIDIPFVPTDSSELVTLAIKFEPNNELNEGRILCKNLNSSTNQDDYTPIISNVADGKLQFWVSEGDETGAIVDKFMSFTEFKNNPNRPEILGVNFYLLFASKKNLRIAESAAFDDWIANIVSNEESKQRLTANDQRRIYQVASGAQVLRNKMP